MEVRRAERREETATVPVCVCVYVRSCFCSTSVLTPTPFVVIHTPCPQILSSVVGFLGCSKDLTACILASQHMQAAVRSARVSFELTGRPRQRLSFPSQSGALSDLVDALIRYMPGGRVSVVLMKLVMKVVAVRA